MVFWQRIAIRYGGIARVPLKGRHVYLISDPELLYQLLVTNRHKYRKNIRYKAAVDTFGAGLLLNEGEAWKRQRLITQPAFKADYIGRQIPAMAALTERFFGRWDHVAGRTRARDVDQDFLRLSQLLAGHYLMGPAFDRIEERFYAAAIAIKDNWPLPPRNILALYQPRSNRKKRRLGRAIADIKALLFEYLAEQRKSDFEDCGLLSLLVSSSREQGDEFDDESLRSQLLTLFFAGHETSATSLSWIHYLLSENPDIRVRVQEEARDVLGQGLPTAEGVDRLTYTEQVINESLRLYSPIHSISRVALEDDTIGGYSIPADSMIYVSLYAVHRLPELWPDADRFDPDRFSAEQSAKRPRFAFIPFAAGHRNCVGANLAMAESKLVVAQIARRFALNLEPSHRVVQAAGTTMYPRFGMKMKISPA